MLIEWTVEMQAQFDQLQRTLIHVITTELRQSEDRLAERLSHHFHVAVEDMSGRMQLLSESVAGAFDIIRGDIRRLDETFHNTLDLHARVIGEHSRDNCRAEAPHLLILANRE